MSATSAAQATVAPSPVRGRIDVSWLLTSVFLASMSLLFAFVHISQWRETGRPTGLAFGALELVLVGVFIARRRPLVVSRRPLDWLVAVIGGYTPLLFRPADGSVLGFGALWAVGEALFTLAAVLCVVRLGRSFGIIAANRGVKVSGPYRIVRHPMYAAYLLAQVAYLLGSFSTINMVVFIVSISGQVARIRSEERILGEDPAYQGYRQRVRFRLIPAVY